MILFFYRQLTETFKENQKIIVFMVKSGKKGKKGTSMILCFYRQLTETFKENQKIIVFMGSGQKIFGVGPEFF
jgi:ribosomal protein S17E